MSAKGKGRAVEVSDSDSDSDAEFFTAKARMGLARAPIRDDSPIEFGDSEPSDDEGPRKKRKYKPKPKPSLPEWTRSSTARKPASRRGTSEPSRASEEPIPLSDSDVEVVETAPPAQPANGKGKGKEKAKEKTRRRVELTPPPENALDPEKKARMHQAFLDHWDSVEAAAMAHTLSDSDSDEGEDSADKGPAIAITVAMVADPDMKQRASAKAIHHYEKPRVFHIPRNDPLRRIVVALGEALNKPTSDIVLVHNGHRIFATNQSPAELEIGDQGVLQGYEKPIWRKIQDEEERKRRERIAAEMSPAPDEEDEVPQSPAPVAAGDDEVAPLMEPPDTDAVDKIKFTVRGEEGNLRLQVRLSTTAGSICRHYCNKYGITGSRADSMRLHFDGESFDPDTQISEMDLEPGDLVDVN